MPTQSRIALVLAALAALAPFAIDTYLPAFPWLAHDLGATTLEIQQSLTFYLLPYALMTLWHGAISDSIGRLATIRWGLLVFALASVGCALAPNVETLWFFRVLQGLSGGAGNVVSRAMVRDLFEGVAAQRVMAQVQMIFGLAPAIAPIVGGILLGIHWQAIFLFLFLYALLALWAAYRFLPETVPPDRRVPLRPRQIWWDYRRIFGDLEFVRLITAFGANFAGFFVYVLAAPVFLIRHLGLNEHQFGMMFVPTVLGMVTGSWLARRMAGRLANGTILRLAYAWMGGAVLLNVSICLFVPAQALLNILPIALYNVGMAFAMPVLSISALDRHPRLRGTAASGQAFVQMMLSTVSAGLVIPLLWDRPLGLAFGMAGYWLLGLVSVRSSAVWSAAKRA
ncbi:bicyclomycin resistance protein [mine drainage metagenome]|uniref:Bicyclomycin resistance protein n=1 Tax=mine drainage metagenome TaxID=410659 RepID=A0A1J5Q0D5_9ZZZZ